MGWGHRGEGVGGTVRDSAGARDDEIRQQDILYVVNNPVKPGLYHIEWLPCMQ